MSIEITTKESFEVQCASCGSTLSARMGGKHSWSKDVIEVDPCRECMKEAAEDAAKEARNEAAGEQA